MTAYQHQKTETIKIFERKYRNHRLPQSIHKVNIIKNKFYKMVLVFILLKIYNDGKLPEKSNVKRKEIYKIKKGGIVCRE